MARLSTDGTKILDNYDRFTGEPFNATKVTTWYDGSAMDDSKVDNAIYFKNTTALGGGYSKRDFTGAANVKWFGAKGDNTTDDTVAIQKAIDSPVNTILIPSGYFLVTATLVVSGSKTIMGISGGSQAFQHTTINHSGSSTGELFNITTVEQQGVCLKNFNIIGGNGSYAIKSSRSYVRYEYIHMEPYNGGGIQLLSTGIGSSSSKIINCQWVAPAVPTDYTGFHIDVNGGDILLQGCTAIRGAIGIDIIKGQTIILDECSVNKQTITFGWSSATQFNTCGIRVTGSDIKQAIDIKNCYIEACTNGVYVESCESLSITDNLFDDAGVCGFDGNGNSHINLTNSTVKNVTIQNNNVVASSNGTVENPFYAIRLNDATNTMVLNNHIKFSGDNSGVFYVTTSPSTYLLANTKMELTGSPVADYNPNSLLKSLMYEVKPNWVAPTLEDTWETEPSYPVQYFLNPQLKLVSLRGSVNSGTTGTAIFTLPVGYRPFTQQSFIVNAGGALGVVTMFTNGQVFFNSGSTSYVYLSNINFYTQ